MAYIGSQRLLNITSKGDSAFIRYSAYADGTDFTATRSEGQNFIGFATAQTAPTDKSQYTWIKNSDLIANVVQTTGGSGTAVMSQKAVTKLFDDSFTLVAERTNQQFDKTADYVTQNIYCRSDSAIAHQFTRLISVPVTVEENSCVCMRIINADKRPSGFNSVGLILSNAIINVGDTHSGKNNAQLYTAQNDYITYRENASASSYVNIEVYCESDTDEDGINEVVNFVKENLMLAVYPTRPTNPHIPYEEYYNRWTIKDEVNGLGKQISSKYGVMWSISNPDDLGTRCFSAEGLTANIGVGSSNGYSDFDSIYPWSEIKRCNIKTNANGSSIVTYEGENGFTLDGSNGDVFVRIPRFNIERYIKDGYEYRVIGNSNAPVHEAFIENGEILDEIFISAFEGYIDANNKLRSIADVIPTSNEIPETYLTSANANGENYSLYDMRCVDAVWSLMAVEFGCRNSNQIIGYGLADFMQAVINDAKLVVKENATNTNSVKVGYFSGNTNKLFMPIGSNIIICDTTQENIIAQRKITNVEDTADGLYTIFTFDGEGIDVNTNCFIGSAAFNTNFCELCTTPLTWHTGRGGFISYRPEAKNPIRYRWIENIVGNLWHYLPDITFKDLQMYVCKDMQKYQFHKHTDEYKPVGDILIENNSNGSKLDNVDVNFWIDSLLNDTFAKSVLWGKSYNKALKSTQAFGGYYYLANGVRCIANGGGFDHLYRCNMLTQRAWIDETERWYLYGARLMFKKIK